MTIGADIAIGVSFTPKNPAVPMATIVDRPITSKVENVAVNERMMSQVSRKMTHEHQRHQRGAIGHAGFGKRVVEHRYTRQVNRQLRVLRLDVGLAGRVRPSPPRALP